MYVYNVSVGFLIMNSTSVIICHHLGKRSFWKIFILIPISINPTK